MILFLLLCGFMVTVQAAPEKVVNYKELDCGFINTPVCLDKEGKPFTGMVYSGTLGGARWEQLYKDGEANSSTKFFDENGKFEREAETPRLVPVPEGVDLKNLKCDKKTKICLDKQEKPFTGVAYFHYPDGGTAEVPLEKGKVSGDVQIFNKNGIFRKRIVGDEYLHLFVEDGIEINDLDCNRETKTCTYKRKPFTGTVFHYNSLTKGHSEMPMKDGKIAGVEKDFDKEGNFKIGHDRDVLVDEKGTPFTGFVIRYYASGQLRSKIPCINGKKQGIARAYRENGFIDKEAPYENGVINGDVKEYDYDEGFLRGKIPYKNGIKEGAAEEYDICGNITISMPFKNDQATGTVKEYYEDGTLKKEATIENGKTTGILKEYSADGELVKETVYKDGEKVNSKEYSPHVDSKETKYTKGGKEYTVITYSDKTKRVYSPEGDKHYYPNGQLEREFRYEGTGADRKFYDKRYYKNGNVELERISSSGSEKDDFRKEYYLNGQLKTEAQYSNGIGFEKEYFPNGTLRRETSYKAGKKDGIEKTYYLDGSIKKETPYVNDKRQGWEKVYFYATGVLMEEILYQDHQHKEFKYYDIKGNPLPKPDVLGGEQYEKFYEKADPKTMSGK